MLASIFSPIQQKTHAFKQRGASPLSNVDFPKVWSSQCAPSSDEGWIHDIPSSGSPTKKAIGNRNDSIALIVAY